MTPKREVYLKKCGKWERKYREWIKLTEERIKEAKYNLNAGVDVEWEKSILRSQKVYLSWYRHELNRLKGMDRVVVPKVSYSFDDDFPIPIFECSCGMILYGASHCERCGRRILWGKTL